jgi:hypothetical protein
LGIGNKFNSSVPTRVKDLDPFEGDYVVEVAGGEHHSIARTKDGLVYCWGRNDEGQVGVGDTYGEYRKQKAEEELAKAEEQAKVAESVKPEHTAEAVAGEQPEPEKKASVKKSRGDKTNVAKEEDLKYIYYFYRPQLVEALWKWELAEGENETEVRKPAIQINAAGQYSYAICKDGVYSWGMGENYVLGNRDDNNEFKPYKLDPRMFEENRVAMIACGTMHVVVLTHDSPDGKMPELTEKVMELPALQVTPTPKKAAPKPKVEKPVTEQHTEIQRPQIKAPILKPEFVEVMPQYPVSVMELPKPIEAVHNHHEASTAIIEPPLLSSCDFLRKPPG